METQGHERGGGQGALGSPLPPTVLVVDSDARALRHWTADRGYRLADTGLNFLAVHEQDPLLPHLAARA